MQILLNLQYLAYQATSDSKECPNSGGIGESQFNNEDHTISVMLIVHYCVRKSVAKFQILELSAMTLLCHA
jgi:hypothetical protein